MIKVNKHIRNNKKGMLITYKNGKEIFFVDAEVEKIKEFLDMQTVNLRESILKALENGKMTLGNLVDTLKVDPDIINNEVAMLEYEGIVEIKSSEKYEHWELGTLHAPFVELKT